MRHAYQQPWEVQQSRMMTASCHPVQQNCYVGYGMNDIVPIQIRQGRGKSLESLEDTERGPVTHLTFTNEGGPQALYVSGAGPGMPSSIMLSGGQQWRRSYDDGDITPTNEASILASYEGGGTLPRPRGFVRPRPVAKVTGNTKAVPQSHFQDFNDKIPYSQQHQQQAYNEYIQYATSTSKYSHLYSPHLTKKMPPQPPKRQSSNSGLDGIYNVGSIHQTTVEIHAENNSPPNKSLPSLHESNKQLPLSLPAYPSSDSLSCVSLESEGLPLPPPPAPCTPPTGIMPSRSWTDGTSRMNEEQMLINTLANQARNGSDASFKSSSSTESDSLPFANENAGTIKQRANASLNRNQSSLEFSRSNSLSRQSGHMHSSSQNADLNSITPHESTEPADVLSDIGNMLANLTDELDAMLEEEKRQGLTDSQ
ncbi:uncharacterized protein LOC113372293 [Ctenocephalides felis]|nr:uncharacterized protein LOC113372293 [Ctenocephalides felis]